MFPISALSWINLVGYLVVFVAIKRIYYELTTGAARRAIIKENGCEPVYHWRHQGILGKLLGLDLIQQQIKDDKLGRTFEGVRQRLFAERNTVQTTSMGIELIQTAEPEIVKTMLSTKFHDFELAQRRLDAIVPSLGHGIFASNGAAWERSRALIRPSFTKTQVADLDTFETHIQHFISAIPRDGSTVDLQPLFFSLTMDSATEFLFGRSTACLAPGLKTQSASEFVKAFEYCTKSIGTEIRTAGLSRWIPDKRWHKSKNIVHAFADSIIREETIRLHPADMEKSAKPGTTCGNERYVFLHELIKQTQDPDTLRSELLNILLAGRDSTAGLLANTWHTIARRPDIWAKLRAEVDTLMGEAPTYAQIKDMKYLRWVLNECLRLMPIVPANGRVAVRDTVIPVGGGADGKAPALVPKGSIVVYHSWTFHKRKDLYGEDADEFRPERWEKLRHGWEYLPFNGGPRICVGQQFALTEASYATIRLMQAFSRIEPRDEREWCASSSLTLASGVGCKVALFES
ncbi:hypothetical protein EPUS_06065 [Endocarpon pusillum Z07020]|uniref:Cytochrome P450 alkane hydroxylase n=1 Tax=Endocarpon pusillum (strain Z07020 / HMAS-L-300199) TaxID=1263415 RepID=U1GKM5_ENDPU|nr:uncharacterized protein EPUS_06065 [Endocarpon pusillum Z07020]ERF72436.1 hypothetical protein EPUS_06065 [Endocarpon pusillum Z07020]